MCVCAKIMTKTTFIEILRIIELEKLVQKMLQILYFDSLFHLSIKNILMHEKDILKDRIRIRFIIMSATKTIGLNINEYIEIK